MSRVTKKEVYLDNAASTQVDPKVIKEMSEAAKLYGNPSSFNNAGRAARARIDKARGQIARFVGVREEGIVFTSSGSEANNLAIFGLAGLMEKPGEILSTPIEHPSVLEPLKELEKRGWKITYLRVDNNGVVDLKDLREKLNPAVSLVTIIYANNEIGTIQPVRKISKIIEATYSRKPLIHIDACQAAGYLEMNLNNLGADLVTFN
jgi:cysteine desulfurase